jgi:hypothetical protein
VAVIANMTPEDYRDYRLANNLKAGSDAQVREFIAKRDAAEAAARPKIVWKRNPNFVRFDQMPGYRSE